MKKPLIRVRRRVRGGLHLVVAWLKKKENRVGLVRDFHAYGGWALASWGAHLVFPPAGLVMFGVFLTWLGLRVPGRTKGQ